MSETKPPRAKPYKLSDVLKEASYKNQEVVRQLRKAISDGTLTRVFESTMGFRGKGNEIQESPAGRGVLKDFLILEGSNFDEWFNEPERNKNFKEVTSSGSSGSGKFKPVTLDDLLNLEPDQLDDLEAKQKEHQTSILAKLGKSKKKNS